MTPNKCLCCGSEYLGNTILKKCLVCTTFTKQPKQENPISERRKKELALIEIYNKFKQ